MAHSTSALPDAGLEHHLSSSPARPRRAGLLRNLLRRKPAAIGLVLYALVVVIALAAPILSPYDPIKISPADILQSPSGSHWLGTDEIGRDVLTRLMYGARISISVSVIAVIIALSVGGFLGLISGFYGGNLSAVIMRVMDALAAFPAILLALGILSALDPGISNAMIAIGVVYIPAFARITRGTVVSIRETEYVEAARASGGTAWYIMVRSILPNCISPILVHSSIAFAHAIIVEAALSFLGLGTQPPTASWGAMLSQGRQFVDQNVWYSVAAGGAIFITVLSLNLLGDGIRDELDPRLGAE